MAPPMLLLPAPLTPASTVTAKAALASAARLARLAGGGYRGAAKLLGSGVQGSQDSSLRAGLLHAGQQLVEAGFERAQPGLARAGQLLEIVERENHGSRGIVLGDHNRAAGSGLVENR